MMHLFPRRLAILLTVGIASVIAPQATAATRNSTRSHRSADARADVLYAYHIYRGNTHSHTGFTWSHGEQWAKSGCRGVPRFTTDPSDSTIRTWALEGNQPPLGKCPSMIIIRVCKLGRPGATDATLN